MKTGTPPRVDGRSLDFSKMIGTTWRRKLLKNFLIWTITTNPLIKTTFLSYLTYTNALKYMIYFEKDLSVLQCLMVELKVYRTTLLSRLSRIKLIVLPDKDTTSGCLSNQKAGIRLKFMLMDFQHRYRRTFNLKQFAF